MLDEEIMEVIRQTAKAVHESDREERRRDMDLMYERFHGEVRIIVEQGQARLEQQGKEIRDSVADHSNRLAALEHR